MLIKSILTKSIVFVIAVTAMNGAALASSMPSFKEFEALHCRLSPIDNTKNLQRNDLLLVFKLDSEGLPKASQIQLLLAQNPNLKELAGELWSKGKYQMLTTKGKLVDSKTHDLGYSGSASGESAELRTLGLKAVSFHANIMDNGGQTLAGIGEFSVKIVGKVDKKAQEVIEKFEITCIDVVLEK